MELTSCTGQVPDMDDIKQKKQKQETILHQNSISPKNNILHCLSGTRSRTLARETTIKCGSGIFHFRTKISLKLMKVEMRKRKKEKVQLNFDFVFHIIYIAFL